MSPFETASDTEESPRRYVVDLKNPHPRLWETEEAHAFTENLRQAEGLRLRENPPLGTHTGFAQELGKWDILCLPEPENKIKTAHSLGDEGTTVFISEYGELVSFSKFLGLGMLGTVLVEPPILFESYREYEFNCVLDGRLPGIGLRLNDRKQVREQKIDYVHDRWPRVSYKIGDLEIKVQFVVHQAVVAQQYIIHNSSQVSSNCEFNLDLGFSARPSTMGDSPMGDWWDNNPQPLAHSSISSTAGGYAAMLWAGDGRGQVQLKVVLFQDGRSVKLNLSNNKSGLSEDIECGNSGAQEEVQESNAEKSSPYHLHTIKIGPGVTQEVTALYSLERCNLKEQEEDGESETKQAAPGHGANNSHSIRSGSEKNENDGKFSVTTTNEMVLSELNEDVESRSNEDETAHEEWFWSYNGDNFQDDLESRVNTEELSKLHADVINQHFLSPGPQYIDVSRILKDNYHGNWTLKSTPIYRLLRRHLQQVLFVYSVSIPRQNGQRSAIVFSEGHIIYNQVAMWGSLHMFRFLLSMYALLDRPEVAELSLRDNLKRQIKSTCERHLDWAFDVARPYKQGWALVYNLNGSYSKDEDFPNAYTWNTGVIQFVKLYEFRMVFQTVDDQLFVLQKLQRRLGPWFESLERLRDPKSNMWISWIVHVSVEWLDPQYRQNEIVRLPAYLVADLIVLWKAFSAVFELLNDTTRESTLAETISSLEASLPKTWRKTFSPSKLRTNIMNRFIYDHVTSVQDPLEPGISTKDDSAQEGESHSNKDTFKDSTKAKELSAQSARDGGESNKVQRKRLLAFRWAGNDKPRYLWYSWASRIFEGVDSGFFNGDSSSRVWKDTLEAQQIHRELSWGKVMRYATALRAAQHGQSLDMTMNADQMRSKVRERLLKCFFSNGEFPDLIDLTTKQPMSRSDHGQVFEIPLLLLGEEVKYSNVDAAMADIDSSNNNNLISPSVPSLPPGVMITDVPAERNTQGMKRLEDDLEFDPEAVAKERAKLAKSATHSARSTKYDRANIRDPPDFEPDWLFPYPDCFASDEPTGSDEETTDIIHEKAKRAVNQFREMSDGSDEPAYKLLQPGMEKYCSARSGKEAYTFSNSVRSGWARVFDVGQSSYAKIHGARSMSNNLEDRLLRKRTWKEAKKRLILIDSLGTEQALLLYLGSADSEKLSTAGFLTRHRMRDGFMRDHAHKEVNLWTTELHLSFYKKISILSDQSHSTPALEESIFEDPEKSSAFPGEPKSSSNKLQKGTIGWRFSGDLHDRRWTGTILAFVPGRGRQSNWISTEDFESDRGFHGQRKIIEARLFSEMVNTIHVSTTEILRDLNMVLDEGDGGIYKGGSEHHDPLTASFDQSYTRSKLYLQLSDFLSHLDDNLKGTMETIEYYMDREKQRPVQPRWSIADERQHRRELSKWDQEGKKNVAVLRTVQSQVSNKRSRVQHLRDSLNADMQLRETRLQARSAEDVRLFTYVTIVFLPISFSSSIFSMQNAPGSSTIGNFAKVAIAALVITFVILFNLKTISRNTWSYLDSTIHKISHTMSISNWNFWKKTHEDLVQAEKRNIQSHEPLQSRRMSKWWYCLFLLAFVLVELPETRVRMAYYVFFPPAKDDPKPPTLLGKIQHVVLGLLFFPLFFPVYAVLFLLGKVNNLNQTSLKGPRLTDEKQSLQSQWIDDGSIAESTHSATTHRLSTTSDKSNTGAMENVGDTISVREGETNPSASTKTRIMRIVNKMGWQASPSKESQPAGNDQV